MSGLEALTVDFPLVENEFGYDEDGYGYVRDLEGIELIFFW